MPNAQLVAHVGAHKITREQLALVPTPAGTLTHRPIPHIELVNGVIDALSFRHIAAVRSEFAVSSDGNKMFGVLDLETEIANIGRFSLGIRNSHDKTMRLAMTVGYRVFVCDNMAFAGDFTPMLAKHSKNFNLLDNVAMGVDRMQRNFKPMITQVEAWQASQISDSDAKLLIYEAFIAGQLDVPGRLARDVHELYFEPKYKEFEPRTAWSLSNAFTSAFKQLDPVPQFKATARLGEFLGQQKRLGPQLPILDAEVIEPGN